MSTPPPAHGDPASGRHSEAHDDGDLRTIYTVFAVLMGLLVLTVAVAYLDFGEAGTLSAEGTPTNPVAFDLALLALPLAMGIAVAKALLILVYFMHLNHEMPLVRVIAASGFVSLSILLVIVFADYIVRT